MGEKNIRLELNPLNRAVHRAKAMRSNAASNHVQSDWFSYLFFKWILLFATPMCVVCLLVCGRSRSDSGQTRHTQSIFFFFP